MKSLESKTARAIRNGQAVHVWVIALYRDDSPVPNSFLYMANGSGGLNLDCVLINGAVTSKADRYKTQWGKCS